MPKKYIEQLERIRRYLKKFSDIHSGIFYAQALENYTDDVYAFFQNCYHLKDWIKNDPSCSAWSDVEKFINSNKDLQICADLCNGLKHLQRMKPRSAQNPHFSRKNVLLNISDSLMGPTETKVAISFVIATASGDIDAFDLARNCVSAWEIYIASNTSARGKQ